MPIGENAIKRVENNGYSKVNTSCPDMENSTAELPAPVPERTMPKKSAPAEKKKENCQRKHQDMTPRNRFWTGICLTGNKPRQSL